MYEDTLSPKLFQSCQRGNNVTSTPSRRRGALAFLTCALAVTLGACTRQEPARAAGPAPVALETVPIRFDVSSLTLSPAKLTAFPYVEMPEGYVELDRRLSDYDRIPFWTGDRLEWIEGKVYAARVVVAKDSKSVSPLELSRDLQRVIESLGGHQIASSRVPENVADQIGLLMGSEYDDALGNFYNNSVTTYVIHGVDGDVWLQVCSDWGTAGLVIAQPQAFRPTATILSATGEATPLSSWLKKRSQGVRTPPPATDAGSAIFDVASLAVSEQELGLFPYVGLPEGLRFSEPYNTLPAFDRLPFWTGDRFEWVEGKVRGGMVETVGGKSFSMLELTRNLQSVVEALGGSEIASNRVPYDRLEEVKASQAYGKCRDALVGIEDNRMRTYVIHRADRDIWIQAGSSQLAQTGGVLIVETQPAAHAIRERVRDSADP